LFRPLGDNGEDAVAASVFRETFEARCDAEEATDEASRGSPEMTFEARSGFPEIASETGISSEMMFEA
jgi:hypothetical protein